MRSKARFLGHSMHAALIALPLGILPLVWIFDLVNLATGVVGWAQVAFVLLSLGILAALVAAIPGLIDLLSLPRDTRAFRVGITHMGVQLAAVGLFIASWLVRAFIGMVGIAPFSLALIGYATVVLGGWLGAELVERMGVGVHDDANLNAPSSLHESRPSSPHAQPPSIPTPLKPTEPQPV